MVMAIGATVAVTVDIADLIAATGMDAIAGTATVMVTAIAGNFAKAFLD